MGDLIQPLRELFIFWYKVHLYYEYTTELYSEMPACLYICIVTEELVFTATATALLRTNNRLSVDGPPEQKIELFLFFAFLLR